MVCSLSRGRKQAQIFTQDAASLRECIVQSCGQKPIIEKQWKPLAYNVERFGLDQQAIAQVVEEVFESGRRTRSVASEAEVLGEERGRSPRQQNNLFFKKDLFVTFPLPRKLDC